MLTPAKKAKLLAALKSYNKKYLHGKMTELDESGTRLMINDLLTNVLGFAALDEVKTEYMIKGTYADYMIQVKGIRHFLVEVKALSLTLSSKHLRQALEYGYNEGVEWALLTNGRTLDLYKIIFGKPVDSKRVFSVSLTEAADLKNITEHVQYLHRDSVVSKGLPFLWNKCCGLDPHNVAAHLYAPVVTKFLRKSLNAKYKSKFSEAEIHAAINRIVCEPIPLNKIKALKPEKAKVKKVKEASKDDKISIHEEVLVRS